MTTQPCAAPTAATHPSLFTAKEPTMSTSKATKLAPLSAGVLAASLGLFEPEARLLWLSSTPEYLAEMAKCEAALGRSARDECSTHSVQALLTPPAQRVAVLLPKPSLP
jgi:hypothetical protein